MPCYSQKYTTEELRDILLNKKVLDIEGMSVPEKAVTLRQMNSMVTTAKVPASELKEGVRRRIGAEAGDMVDRYVVDNHLIAQGRTSDIMQAKFIKSRKSVDEARKISNLADNVLKAETGTRFHWGGERLFERFIEADTSGMVYKLSELDGQPVQQVSDKDIMTSLGINEKQFKTFEQGVKQVYDVVVDTQRKINPNEKVAILPEQFVYNPDTDVGSTIDILALYSDGTHSNVDYKTMMPPKNTLTTDNVANRNLIMDEDWVPFYKIEAFHDQLSQTNNTMKDIYGSTGTRLSRVVPIHVRFANKPKSQQDEGQYLMDKITHVSIGTDVSKGGDPALQHIPVGELVTLTQNPRLAEELNQQIGRLSTIINNRMIERESLPFIVDGKVNPRRERLTYKINQTRRAMNKLIINQDFKSLYSDFGEIIKNINNEGIFDYTKNIHDPEINGKPNPDYVELSRIKELLDEVRAYRGVLDASGHYLAEIGVTPDMSQDYLQSVARLQSESGITVKRLESLLIDRELTAAEYSAFDNVTNVTTYEKHLRTLREQVAMPFRKLSEHLDRAVSMKREAMQKMEKDIKDNMKLLNDYGKKHNMPLQEVYNLLINDETENLHSVLKGEFYRDLKKAQTTGDTAWLNKNLKLRDNYKELFDQNVYVHKRNVPNESKRDYDLWLKRNSPKALLQDSKKWWIYYEPVHNAEYISDGYKRISQSPELLKFYNFWTETMEELNGMVGLSRNEHLPKNFLPYIRGSMVEQTAQGTFGFKSIQESLKSLYQVREDDVNLGDFTKEGKRDPVTGRPVYTIPRYFLNPLKNNAGRISKGMKLRDLGKSLLIYADMAYNYNFIQNEVQPHADALREIMIMKGMQETTKSGRKKTLLSGALAKITGEGTDIVQLYDQMVNYHVYGVKIQDASREWIKRLGFAKGTQSKIELSFSPLLWIGNLAQITTNSYLEGHNGYFYDKMTMARTMAESMGVKGKEAKKKIDATTYVFEFSPGITDVRRKKIGSTFASRWINWDTAFIGMRKSEQAINNYIGISVMKSHGLDADGNIIRLSTAPKGTKSLFDMVYFDKEGNWRMENITDENGKWINPKLYSQIRNLGLGVSKTVKGQLNPEDLSSIFMTLGGNALMGFKTWMPGMIDARFTGLRFNSMTNSLMEGKYRTLISDMAKDDRSYVEWLANVVMPSLGNMALHITTFGMKGYKVNEARARTMFNQYKQQNVGDPAIDLMKFEDFMEFKQGQIKSLASELTMILAIVGAVMVLRADWDDDGEPLWKSNFLSRTAFRAVNRARREIAFFVSPGDWTALFRMPAPVMSLPVDATNAIKSASEGIWDIVVGAEPDPRQRRSKFYPAWRMIPGNKLLLMFEADEMSKLREL